MANLRDLRKRIRTIESTRKIMMAMKMISASRLSSVRSSHDNARHYKQSLHDAFSALYTLLPPTAAHDAFVQWYTQPHTPLSQPVKLFVIIGSDKGLCGGYNLNLMKRLRVEISTEAHAGYRIHLLPLGHRIRSLCSALYPQFCLTDTFPYNDSLLPMPASDRLTLKDWRAQQRGIDYATASNLADFLYKISFVHRQIHECVVLSNRFFSILKQEPVLTPLFPYTVPAFSSDSAFFAADGDPLLAFKSLILPHLTHHLYALWIEGNTAEYAARMTAMDNASRNAKDIQDRLTLALNRTRQAKVTTELSEIVAGAEAV